jgi:NAD(P)-dependent dehydrogenase (short-subunit alcohol dehydrogenase family)
LINPGHILTKDGVWERKMLNNKEEFEKFISLNIPLGRIGQVEDVAELVFLTANNDFGKYLTGSRINLDGGTSLIS